MFCLTATESNQLFRAYDEGDDIKVVISGATPQDSERWFSRHTHKNESFRACAERVFNALAGELNTKINPIVG